MIVRAIDSNGDWTFGRGLNDYRSNQAAVVQNIDTRLKCFLGDCFFDQGAGINWIGFLGSKDRVGLNLSIAATILNTREVLSMIQLFESLSSGRVFAVSYNVSTAYGVVQAQTAITAGAGV